MTTWSLRVGLLVALCLHQPQRESQGPPNSLLQANLTDGVSVTVNHHVRGFSVQLYGPLGRERRFPQQSPEVWLLAQDGTTVPQVSHSFGGGNPGFESDFASFEFAQPATNLSGVVIRLDGKLYAREIQSPKSN